MRYKLKSVLDRFAREIRNTLWQTWLRITLTPIRWATPRNQKLWVIIGKGNSQFNDNVKYFYCWLKQEAQDEIRIYYLISNPDIARALEMNGGLTCHPESFRSRLLLLRAGVVIVDSTGPLITKNREWYRGSIFVQLWHGVGFKPVEHSLRAKTLSRFPKMLRPLLNSQSYLVNDFPKYDYFISTSQFYTDKVFKPAIRARQFLNIGYSRNDYLLGSITDDNSFVHVNTGNDSLRDKIKRKNEGWKIIVYAPTYRDNRLTAFDEGVLDIDELEDYCQRNKILLLLKLHAFATQLTANSELVSIHAVDPRSDIYPILKITDLLITDYSSIASDFLLLDRPIIYFAYDYKRYLQDSRAPMFDYDQMTPGPKCQTFAELCETIETTLFTDEPDPWATKRSEIRKLAFGDFNGDASEQLWAVLRPTA